MRSHALSCALVGCKMCQPLRHARMTVTRHSRPLAFEKSGTSRVKRRFAPVRMKREAIGAVVTAPNDDCMRHPSASTDRAIKEVPALERIDDDDDDIMRQLGLASGIVVPACLAHAGAPAVPASPAASPAPALAPAPAPAPAPPLHLASASAASRTSVPVTGPSTMLHSQLMTIDKKQLS